MTKTSLIKILRFKREKKENRDENIIGLEELQLKMEENNRNMSKLNRK